MTEERLTPIHPGEILLEEFRLFGISRGWDIGVPNLLGVWRKESEQVRDSDASSTQSPREPLSLRESEGASKETQWTWRNSLTSPFL